MVKHWNQHWGWPIIGLGMSVLLASSLVAPFMFVCLAVMAYKKSVGIVALSLAGAVWCGSIFSAIIWLRLDLEDTKKAKRKATGLVHSGSNRTTES